MQLDWNQYIEVSRRAVSEGVVLIKNENKALPLQKNAEIALFGRIQSHYYKSGTGSGGMVNVVRAIGILDALLEDPEVKVNEDLLAAYREWEKTNPFDPGLGWGNEPWSQKEMPLADELVAKIAAETDTAVVLIGRLAGEEKDNQDLPGSYRLTDAERDMLARVRAAFPRMIVVLNVGNIIDISFDREFGPDAILYAWQGGMVGGLGICDVLTGRVNPSGKLTDTIAYRVEDYPSHDFFGGTDFNFYAEDIYVGYRYFETAAPERVAYPFGFGLSYTTFQIDASFTAASDSRSVRAHVTVTNTGDVPGKEVVQFYVKAPQGALGKPARALIDFAKTRTLVPGETQTIELTADAYSFSSYDDSGVTGNKSCYLLEAGEYIFYVGNSVRAALPAGHLVLPELIVLDRLSSALAPVTPFLRMKPATDKDGAESMVWEPVPLATETQESIRLRNLPPEIPVTGDQGLKLADVRAGRVSLAEFVAQLDDEELATIIRGEGMGSPKVTPGTAAAFGGVSDSLREKGVPCGCCADGPSGIRMDCGTKAFSLPNGTLLASTFNEELLEELFTYVGKELVKNHVDTLLGPGMNIHRHPLNGRNFEYFSEDPLLTGRLASAELRGMAESGVTGTIKHFCANNQETHRHDIDSIVSERALREIYLKGFEIAVRQAKATSVMTTYGSVNGLWTAGQYDLNTRILRDEWGFDGIVMTDWWAFINERGGGPTKTNFAAMVRAQNDLYMVCPDAAKNSTGDNTLQSLSDGSLTRAELQRSAMNILRFLLHTPAFLRSVGEAPEVDVLHMPVDPDDIQFDKITYYKVDDGTEIDLSSAVAAKGSTFVFALDAVTQGGYTVEVIGRSDLGDLAQIPMTIFVQSTPVAMITWNGTGGQWVSKKKKILLHAKYVIGRFYFGEGGIELQKMIFRLDKPLQEIENIDAYIFD